MALVERGVHLDPVVARIVGVGLAAADAGRSGLHAPAAAVVPHDHAAVRLRLRSAAAERIEAVAQGLLLAAELVDELAVLEVAAAFAVVVHRLAEDAGGLALARQVELGGRKTQEHDVGENGDEPLGVRRTARDVHDRRVDALLLQVLLHAERARLVGMRAHPAAVDRARAERDHSGSVFGRIDQMIRARLVGHAQRLAAPALEHGPLVHEDVVPGALLDGLIFGQLHGLAGGSRQRLGVVERDHLEHDRRRVGSLHLRERFRAARARRAFDPDDRVQLALRCADHGRLEGLRHARRRKLGQPRRHRDRAAQFHEAAPADAARGKHLLKL